MKNFTKILGHKHTGSVFYKGNFYPYSVEYTGEDEYGDGSLFNIILPGFEQEFLEEDIEEFFTNTVYALLDIFLENQHKEETLQSLTIRVFESDVEFLKRYATEHNMKYQTIMRDFIRKGTRELQL